jgi:hypothetical protein
MLRRLWRREVLRIACPNLRGFFINAWGGRHDCRMGVEWRLLYCQIARGRVCNCVMDSRRIELNCFVQIGRVNGEKQSAVVRAELLGISLERAITFGATFHLSFLD